MYFPKRYLNTALQRWVSADPLTVHAAGADPNLYAYVSGMALKSVDPLGLQDGAGGAGAINEGGTSTQPGADEAQLKQQEISAQQQFSAAAARAAEAEAELARYYEANPLQAQMEDMQGAEAGLLNSLVGNYQQALTELYDAQAQLNRSLGVPEGLVGNALRGAIEQSENLRQDVPDSPAGRAGAQRGPIAAVVLPGPKALKGKGSAAGGPVHHLATNKNFKSAVRGGPWSPRFKKLFDKAGMSLDDAANKIPVPGHKGPHPEAYHQAVLDRLEGATKGLRGDAYGQALRSELEALGREATSRGSVLNKLLTKQ